MFNSLISSFSTNNLLHAVKSFANNSKLVLQSKSYSFSRWRKRININTNKKMVRTWGRVKSAGPSSVLGGNKVFTLLSYNILAQDLLTEHLHLYIGIEPAMLRWDHRLMRLTEEIQHLKPDILCLQEMQFNHLKSLVKHISFKRELEYVFKKKTGHRTDGCAIIYDKSKFRLLADQPVEYYTEGHAVLNRDNVALLAKFSVKKNPEDKFIVATTHLLYNPKRQDIRVAQVKKLLAAIQQFSVEKMDGKNVLLPIILTGDFNFEPETTPYHILSTPFRLHKAMTNLRESESSLCGEEAKRGEETKMEYYLRAPGGEDENNNSLQMSPLDFGKDTASTFQENWITVDYVLHSIDENRRKIQIQSVYELPKINDCISTGLIPNKFLGSDHYSLGIKFSLL